MTTAWGQVSRRPMETHSLRWSKRERYDVRCIHGHNKATFQFMDGADSLTLPAGVRWTGRSEQQEVDGQGQGGACRSREDNGILLSLLPLCLPLTDWLQIALVVRFLSIANTHTRAYVPSRTQNQITKVLDPTITRQTLGGTWKENN